VAGAVSESVRIRSTVNWAVLALVIERPSYGYELGQRFERRFGTVLEPQISQIYAALNSLESALFIEPLLPDDAPSVELETPPRRAAPRQPKVHYRATAKGARAFRSWLGEQLREDPGHSELLRRLAAAAGAGLGRTRAMEELIDRYEHATLEEASRLPLRNRDRGPAATRDELIDRLVLGARRALLDAQHEWVAHARAEIRAFAAAQGEPDEPAGA
jgi:DNA-binding PadR family transcriptional regulator